MSEGEAGSPRTHASAANRTGDWLRLIVPGHQQQANAHSKRIACELLFFFVDNKRHKARFQFEIDALPAV